MPQGLGLLEQRGRNLVVERSDLARVAHEARHERHRRRDRQHVVSEPAQPLARRHLGVEHVVKAVQVLLLLERDRRPHDLSLGAEVEIDGPLRDPGQLGDLAHVRLAVALPRKQLGPGANDAQSLATLGVALVDDPDGVVQQLLDSGEVHLHK